MLINKPTFQAFKTVPSVDVSRRFIMHFFDVRLTPIFFADSNNMFMERFRRALLTHKVSPVFFHILVL